MNAESSLEALPPPKRMSPAPWVMQDMEHPERRSQFSFPHWWALSFLLESLQSFILKSTEKNHPSSWLRWIAQNREKKDAFLLILSLESYGLETGTLHCHHCLHAYTSMHKSGTLLFCIQRGKFPTLWYCCAKWIIRNLPRLRRIFHIWEEWDCGRAL